jgi:hypothetical protein
VIDRYPISVDQRPRKSVSTSLKGTPRLSVARSCASSYSVASQGDSQSVTSDETLRVEKSRVLDKVTQEPKEKKEAWGRRA